MATKERDDPMVVVESSGYVSVMLPMSKAQELATLLMLATKVEWEYSTRRWKPSSSDNHVTIKQVTQAQMAAYTMDLDE